MRALYLAMGIFLGGLATVNQANFILDYVTETFEEQISIYTLVGYYEGWQRGRDMTARMIGWRLAQCMEDSNRKGR